MTSRRQIFEHMYPSGADWGLMSLSLTALALADRTGCTLEDWEEDGLGPAQGFGLRLDAGWVILVKQLLLAENSHSTIFVDAREASELGAEAFIELVLAALKVDPSEIAWRPDDADGWAVSAADLARRASRFRRETLAKAGSKETDS